jgi:hypothetical protein
LELRVEADLKRGQHAVLVGELEALVAEHRLRERLRSQLMLALYRSERQAASFSSSSGRFSSSTLARARARALAAAAVNGGSRAAVVEAEEPAPLPHLQAERASRDDRRRGPFRSRPLLLAAACTRHARGLTRAKTAPPSAECQAGVSASGDGLPRPRTRGGANARRLHHRRSARCRARARRRNGHVKRDF